MTKVTPVRRELRIPPQTDGQRIAPVAFMQSALFRVGGKNAKRVDFKDKIVASAPGVKLIYSGTELRQDDLDVFAQLLHEARDSLVDSKEGLEVRFSGYGLLSKLEQPQTKRYYDNLRASLDRLQKGTINVTLVDPLSQRTNKVQAQLLRKFFVREDEKQSQWHVWIEPEVAELLHPKQARMEWSERKLLDRPISKWLHGHMSSFGDQEVFAAPETELMRLSGTGTSSMRTFRASIKDGLTEMSDKGVIFDWKIHEGVVFVARKAGVELLRAVIAARVQYELLLQPPEETDIEQ